MLVKDAHRFICNTCPTLTNAEVAASLIRWQVVNDVLIDHDEGMGYPAPLSRPSL